MFPQLYLKTFWRMELKPDVFVAMSFDDKYKSRFTDIIEPAINSIIVNGNNFCARRVDTSKSGDSIHTEIMDGIAHSNLFLADVSSIGKDSVSGDTYRNGNVMYEVGLALSSRLPSEVLLIRDDKDKFLFDVSAIPHQHIDFTDNEKAKKELTDLLNDRINERNSLQDARINIVASSMTEKEIIQVKHMAEIPENSVLNFNLKGNQALFDIVIITRLLDKQLIRYIGDSDDGRPCYVLTPFGKIAANYLIKQKRITSQSCQR
ncbi:MAG: hypothetical protein KZQ95_12840 [Candidatus Thiodiazotropha sp. (ex Epidulcina cf. delphinae)]|nr:hypothetical protein [Candidatus Thiodiazotropha sp. (ex Epidulcina cf. delphinae)]